MMLFRSTVMALIAFCVALLSFHKGFAAHGVNNGYELPIRYTIVSVHSVEKTDKVDASGTPLYTVRFALNCNMQFEKVITSKLDNGVTLVGVVVLADSSQNCVDSPFVSALQEKLVPLKFERALGGWAPLQP